MFEYITTIANKRFVNKGFVLRALCKAGFKPTGEDTFNNATCQATLIMGKDSFYRVNIRFI